MHLFRMVLIGLLVTLALIPTGPAAAQDVTLNVISHRYPALEFVVGQMDEVDGVNVEATLVPWDRQREIAVINLSAKSDAFDIVYADPQLVPQYAANGWILPLDEYIEKYRDKYNLGDISSTLLNNLSYNGKVYALPPDANVMFLFYRKDLFKQAGLEPPDTIEEMIHAARVLTTDNRYGIAMTLKVGDGFINDFHFFLSTVGGRWFDEEMHPVFNDEHGVKALQIISELMQYAPPDALSYHNDEATAALQQGTAAMAIQWHSRAGSVDDESVSKVVGKIGFKPSPGLNPGEQGVTRVAHGGYAISAFTSHDPELVFRVIAEAISEESLREGAEYMLPPRKSMTEDAELVKKYRSWSAAMQQLETARPTPDFEHWAPLFNLISRPLHAALTGEQRMQEALDEAASEVESFLRRRGYYE